MFDGGPAAAAAAAAAAAVPVLVASNKFGVITVTQS
jgi:hypothetical protein